MPRSIPAYAELPNLADVWRRGAAAAVGRRVLATRSGRIGLGLTAVVGATAVFAPLLATADPWALAGPPLAPPSAAHPLGTDALGRDLYSGVLFGGRSSLLIAGAATVLAFGIGVAMGMLAGYASRRVDDALMRISELFQVIPRLLLMIIAVALVGAGPGVLILVLGLTSWAAPARAIRAEVVALRELDFVRAAVAAGASPWRVMHRELLPNLVPLIGALLGLLFAQMLVIEATLGFLGAADPDTLSWGLLAGQAHAFVRTGWWLALFPGLAVTLAALGVHLLADAWSRPPA